MRDPITEQFIAFCTGFMLGGFIIGATMTAICFYYFFDMGV